SLSAKKEAGHNREQRRPASDLQRVAGELADERRHGGAVERFREGGAALEGGLGEFEACRIGADLPHCSEVKVEMTHGFAGGAGVGFLAEHDLIDQLRGLT